MPWIAGRQAAAEKPSGPREPPPRVVGAELSPGLRILRENTGLAAVLALKMQVWLLFGR